jgi:hypothetical protein
VLFDVTLYGVVMVNNIWRETMPLSGGQIYIWSNLCIMKLVQNVNLMRPEIFSGSENTGHKINIITPVIRQTDRQSSVEISSKGKAIKPRLFSSYPQFCLKASNSLALLVVNGWCSPLSMQNL